MPRARAHVELVGSTAIEHSSSPVLARQKAGYRPLQTRPREVSLARGVEQQEVDCVQWKLDQVPDGDGSQICFRHTGPLPPHSFVELAART